MTRYLVRVILIEGNGLGILVSNRDIDLLEIPVCNTNSMIPMVMHGHGGLIARVPRPNAS